MTTPKKKQTTTPTDNPAVIPVTHVQVFPLKEPMGKTLAFARIVLADQLQLTGIRIIDGISGPFVSYPNDPTHKGEDYRSIYYPLTRDLRDELERAILKQYQSVTGAKE